MIDTLEGIIPSVILGDEEEAGEAIGEEHLTTFKVGGEETWGHGTGFKGIHMTAAPFNARVSEPVGAEGTGTGSDGTGHDDAELGIP